MNFWVASLTVCKERSVIPAKLKIASVLRAHRKHPYCHAFRDQRNLFDLNLETCLLDSNEQTFVTAKTLKLFLWHGQN